MIDKVTFRWDGPVQAARVLANAHNIRERADTTTGEVQATGHLGCMDFRVNSRGVWATGSLHKFRHGNNACPFRRRAVQEAVEALSEQTGLHLSDATISQVEFGATVPLPRPVADYLPSLGDRPLMERCTHGGGSIRYESARRVLRLYDKIAEASRDKGELVKGNMVTVFGTGWEVGVPESLRGGHAIRYEVGMRKKAGMQLGRPGLTLGMLHRPDVYRELWARWLAEFERIRPVPAIAVSGILGGGVKVIQQRALAYVMQMNGGIAPFLAALKEGQRAGLTNKKEAQRLREMLRNASLLPGVQGGMDLHHELRAALHNWAAGAR